MTTNTNATSRTAGYFTKKPVTIEAVEYTRRFNWPEWFRDAVSRNDVIVHGTGKFARTDEPCYCEIKTLEGTMRAEEGDWIIRGVKGELYPCKPDIFEATYSRAALTTAAAVPAYPELPDFDAVEQHIYAGCRRFIDRDMLEPIHSLIREAVDADRAMRAQAAPVAQGDALPREDFAWMVVKVACETEPADEDDPECIRILRIDLKSAVLAAFLRLDAARTQAKEGAIHE